MADAHTVAKPSIAKRAVLAIPVLLAIAIAVNWSSIRSITAGKKSLRGVIYGIAGEGEANMGGWKMPENVGAEDAKVTIEVFMREGDTCHVEMLYLGQALATLDPERIRTVFMDTGSEQGSERYAELELGCEQGLAINGETEFKTAREGEKEGKFYTTLDGGWHPEDLLKIIDEDLKEAYDGKGLPMGTEQALVKFKAERALAQEVAETKAKARQEAEKE